MNRTWPLLLIVLASASVCAQDARRSSEDRAHASAREVGVDAAAMEAEIHRTGAVVLYGIRFETDQAKLQAGSGKVLAEIVKLLTDRTDWRFEVQAHTDHAGEKARNLALSEQRARAIVEWLTTHGIAASRLVAKGYGDTVPLSNTTPDAERARNARVELKKLHEE